MELEKGYTVGTVSVCQRSNVHQSNKRNSWTNAHKAAAAYTFPLSLGVECRDAPLYVLSIPVAHRLVLDFR